MELWLLILSCSLLNCIKASPSIIRRDVSDNEVDSGLEEVISHVKHLAGKVFGLPSNETGIKVAEWQENHGINPEELGEYAEGDILFPIQKGRNGLKVLSARWPGGIIPYMLSPYFAGANKALIMEAMDDYHKHTCIRFVPYNGDGNDYIRITAGNTGCWSSVGRIGGRQDLNLQVPGCVTKKGTIIHELMHAVGFLHEQSRHERDQYVTINWNNIQPRHSGNFDKSSKEISDAFGVGYDYGSVMHYSSYAFSRNGQPTIVPKEGNGLLDLIGEIFQGKTKTMLGQREGFSKNDILKIRRMYKCNKRRRSYE